MGGVRDFLGRSFRFESSVLDWNQKAIGFYERLGAQTMPEWQTYRWTENALRKLADG